MTQCVAVVSRDGGGMQCSVAQAVGVGRRLVNNGRASRVSSKTERECYRDRMGEGRRGEGTVRVQVCRFAGLQICRCAGVVHARCFLEGRNGPVQAKVQGPRSKGDGERETGMAWVIIERCRTQPRDGGGGDQEVPISGNNNTKPGRLFLAPGAVTAHAHNAEGIGAKRESTYYVFRYSADTGMCDERGRAQEPEQYTIPRPR